VGKTRTKAKARFNSVKMMRTIRDRLSAELGGMTWDEEKRYIDRHLGAKRGQSHGIPSSVITPG
jgi:hypothetical protein